jgi:SAM-dependent methyltransferase
MFCRLYPKINKLFQNRRKANDDNEEETKILDLCCGQGLFPFFISGRHVLYLADNFPQLKLYGHDQSSYLINLANERNSGRKNVVFTVGDCRGVNYPTNFFNFVMILGNSFGYFGVEEDIATDVGDKAVLREVNRLLAPGGHVIIDLADGEYMRKNFSPRSWEWIDDNSFVCRERVLSKDKKRLHSREVVVMVVGGVIRDQFYSERLYGHDELVSMLEEHGFSVLESEVPSALTTARELSARGQDLGMMEQRLLLFAQKTRDL